MPSGSFQFPGSNPFGVDLDTPFFAANNEFEYDADESNILGSNSIFEFSSGDFFDQPVFGDPKAFPPGSSPSAQPNSNGAAPGLSSLPSHRGSSSSSSTRISGTSNSPKTSQSSADVMMTDEPLTLWTVDTDSQHEDPHFMCDTLNPATIEMASVFDFESASTSPSQTNAPMQESSGLGELGPNGPVAKKIKGHHKGQSQHSLTTSMNGLNTSGSRENSPMPSIPFGRDSSPSSVFKNPPSPDGALNHFNGGLLNMNMGPAWPSMSGLHSKGSMTQVRPESTSVVAHAHGLPYSHMTLHQGRRPRLVVQPTPLKSRVETQIPIKLTIHHLPQGIKRLHLPTHTISKPKLLAKPVASRSPDMLELYTMLVCTSAMQDPVKLRRAYERAAAARHDFPSPRRTDDGCDEEEYKPQNGGEVRICTGCITRERKRAGRKKHKKPEEEELWNRYEHERVIVFNTQEVKEWQAVTPHMLDPTGAGGPDISVPDGTVQVDAPMRIACYCRHHSEKMGFQVIFTMKDYKDNVVAQQISSSIMITDDHKTHLPAASVAQSSNPVVSPIGAAPIPTPNGAKSIEAPLAFNPSQPTSDIHGLSHNGAFTFPQTSSNSIQVGSVAAAPRNLSRQASPTSPSGPVTKKRKASGSIKLPNNLAMTRIETSQSPPTLPPGMQNDSTVTSAATSPFSPNTGSFPMNTDSLFSQNQQHQLNNVGQRFPTSPPTPNNNPGEAIFQTGNRNMNFDNAQVQQMFSAPTSTHPSRAPSPNRLMNDIQTMTHTSLAQNLFRNPPVVNSTSPGPIIYKVIPGEGPKSGGTEVTILGSGFTNHGLEVMFGEQRAATTTYWGETSLVCLVPPSSTAGMVPVTIKHPNMPPQHLFDSNPKTLFRYIDDDETRLIRTALTVLGNKLGGKITDVADIARGIIYGSGNNNGGSWGPSPNGSQNSTFNNNLEQDLSESLEVGLLRILELIDLDDSANKAKINLRRSSGQTMLHLACSLGLDRFVAGLISRGANVGMRDKGGFTPLHFAAMNNRPAIVRLLIAKGADPNMRSLSGLTPADVTQSREVLRVLRRIESHSRSRSGDSLRSRANSASSLRSLWESPSMSQANHDEFLSEDPSSMDDEDGGNDDRQENSQWLDMRRPSFPHARLRDMSPRRLANEAAPATPTAAMTHIRDQFSAQLQQWQHSVAMHLQSLPQLQMPHMQMPQIPTLPPMPMIPDYQAYLYSAPVVQRISSLVPNIRSSRPESSGEQPPADANNKWWELFSGKESPPPAYNTIFPSDNSDVRDIKQASAAAAAAEFEADIKCAALYDQTTSEASTETSQSKEVPALLEIGHKRNITKEQQENLQRAHAQRLKTGSSDKMLWFVWIPILVFTLGAMLLSVAPTLATCTTTLIATYNTLTTNPREVIQRFIPDTLGPV
ncbi:hypothetical protein M426DRAFT_22909 [Hypoxylon sp. CI-4A]|nr:hypothetical protein M426DRAFT_22909 [Hypoxylon sp. CI-4A]